MHSMQLRKPLQTVRMSTVVKPELLAPAGDAECFAAALQFGADAVYIGAKEYGMRAAAKNFDFDAADVNDDHTITMADANKIVNIFLGAK